MPTYEYECTACAHRFERFQSMSASPLEFCPRCGGSLRRLIGTGGGILFKGGRPSGASGATGSRRQGCAFEQRGTTCCGRSEPCGSPGCER